jgi:hypothetical protein
VDEAASKQQQRMRPGVGPAKRANVFIEPLLSGESRVNAMYQTGAGFRQHEAMNSPFNATD